MHRRALVLICVLLVVGCTVTPDSGSPAVGPAGIVLITADGATLDSSSQTMPTTLGLHISAARPLAATEVKVAVDGQPETVNAAADGGVNVSAPALALGSHHHLTLSVATQTMYDDDIRIIDVTAVMAAVHTEGSSLVVDVLFSSDPDKTAVANSVGVPATTWIDPRHLHGVWTSAAPATLHIPANLVVLHGSHLAGSVDVVLSPAPAAGTLRRVTVPAVAALTPMAVVGYSVGTAASRQSVAANAAHLTTVSPAGWRARADGSLSGTPDAPAVASARTARLHVNPLVQNDATDGASTAALLGSDSARAALVSNISAAVSSGGYDGVHLDIEGVDGADRDHLTALVVALGRSLHNRMATLDVDIVPHKPDHLNLYSAAYDVPGIAAAADHVVVMGYDQHTASTDSGPVAGLDWTATLFDGTLSGIPSAKVVAGIPLYARTWQAHTAVADSYAASLMTALSTPGAVVNYDFAAATPSIEFTPDGSGGPAVCYFDDAQSLAAKASLAQSRGYAGVALWRLGFEDPAWWSLVPAH